MTVPDLDKLSEWATKEFADHKLTIMRDDGLYRHLRCQKPGTWVYGFDIVTWPGYLCVCGDIGTWVFSRERDMVQWFERMDGRINPDYWSEKLQDGHERARQTEWQYSEEYGAEGLVDVGWNTQFIYVCHGIVLALKLYRAETKVR